MRPFGDPVLKRAAAPVDRSAAGRQAQVEPMGALVGSARGVGLAAPQLGLSLRLLVYRGGEDAPLVALANPEVESASEDEEAMAEGCLSIPGIHVDEERPIYVRVRARDPAGQER